MSMNSIQITLCKTLRESKLVFNPKTKIKQNDEIIGQAELSKIGDYLLVTNAKLFGDYGKIVGFEIEGKILVMNKGVTEEFEILNLIPIKC